MNQLREERRLRKSKTKNSQHKNKLGKRIITSNPSKVTQFAPRMYGYLFLCLILVYLRKVKGIPDTRSIKRVFLLNQQSDVQFVWPVDK